MHLSKSLAASCWSLLCSNQWVQASALSAHGVKMSESSVGRKVSFLIHLKSRLDPFWSDPLRPFGIPSESHRLCGRGKTALPLAAEHSDERFVSVSYFGKVRSVNNSSLARPVELCDRTGWGFPEKGPMPDPMLFTDCHIKVVELLLTAAASVETKDKLGYDPRAGRRGEVSKGNDASASGVDELHRVTPLKSYIWLYMAH